MGGFDIAHRRLAASRLIGRGFTTPAEAVDWHLAMQAQDYAPASWSIGQRSTGLHHDDVDRALEDGSIVRTHVLRETWHFVAREDLRWLLALSGPRVLRAAARRFAELGLDARARTRAEKLIVKALSGGARLTRKQLGEVLARGRFDRGGQRMPYVLMHCELEGVIASGGLSGKQQTYALLDGRVPTGRSLAREEAVTELVRRYLRSHGPATLKDLSWWSGLTIRDLRPALEGLGDEVLSEAVDGLTVWSSSTGAPAGSATGVYLLQAYDETVVGYTESRFMGDPSRERARAAWGDRSVPSGFVAVDGRLAGHWRRAVGPKTIGVEVHLYDGRRRGLPARIDRAASALGEFFRRPVTLDVRAISG